MKTFKISFQDINDNELWVSICYKNDMDDATNYANLILKTSKWNDAVKFEITEHKNKTK